MSNKGVDNVVLHKVRKLYEESKNELSMEADLKSQKSLFDRILAVERCNTLRKVISLMEVDNRCLVKKDAGTCYNLTQEDVDIIITSLKNLQYDINTKIENETNMKILNNYCIHEEKVYLLLQKILKG